MTEPVAKIPRQSFYVRGWLLAVAALMIATLLVGGATRLTESGLSIVEWKPVLGVVPPVSDADWQAEFAKYQTIPQYRELNRGMSLGDFKTIYWWEWSHRLLARTVGAVFLLPFLYFLWRGWIAPRLRTRLWIIFGGGAALGAVGWWMVSSGLANRTSVSQYRLAFHLTLACAVYAAIVWTSQQVMPRPAVVSPSRLRHVSGLLFVLVLGQIYAGALVAGLDAGLTFNTWPLIDGALVPNSARLWFETPWWRNLFENALTVQFVHRMIAYGLWLLALAHAFDAHRTSSDGRTRNLAMVLFAAVTVQAAIGISTLLMVVPIGMALLHQGTAIIVLTIAVVHAERLRHRVATAPASSAGAVVAAT